MVTNFFRLAFPSATYQVRRLPYSEERLTSLRREYNAEASFFRNGDYVYVSPRVGSDLQAGETAHLSVEESPAVVLSLVRHLLFRTFRDSFPERIPESFAPLRFFSARPEHDPLSSKLPSELRGEIAYPRMVEVQVREIVENGRPVFGLLVGSRQRWQFKMSLQSLVNQGFDIVGKTVLESVPIPGLDGVLAPDETLLGEVVAVGDGNIRIRTNEGLIDRPLEVLQLQRTREQIGCFLEFKLGRDRATQIFRTLQEARRERENVGSHYREILKFASWFHGTKSQPRVYENAIGFRFTVTPNNIFENSSIQLHRTSLIFDYGPGASELTPFTGLSKFGPFNAARFERNDLRMLVLTRPESRGAVTQFLKQLIDGIPQSRYFHRGLKALFRLSSVSPVVIEVRTPTAEGYELAIDMAMRDSDTASFDIALIECADGSHKIAPAINPYYRARVRLMSYGIPTQGVRDQHLRAAQGKLQYTLGPLALQIYAKVGGTPWRLPSTQSVDREILIGIGNALERPNLWSGAEQSRIVGITTFFLGDGSYVLGERLRSVPYLHYFDELLKALRISISTLAKDYAWRDGDTVRIVFHIFKPIKNIEADVVAELIKGFPQFTILFAFVTISTEHPWAMFRGSVQEDGEETVCVCERGDNLILDSHNCLLQIRGDKDRPNRQQRPPYPVSIRVHERSTYKDLKFIVQQIHDFAFLSWRSYFPSETPVTVFYSSLIAAESSKLNKIQNWNAGFLDKHFRRKQWFL
jgi:hypothetical protein